MFDENKSLFEELFEDPLQALGFGRKPFENPHSARSLALPDLRAILTTQTFHKSQNCSEQPLGWVFPVPPRTLPCLTLRARDVPEEESKGGFLFCLFFLKESRSPEPSGRYSVKITHGKVQRAFC